MEPRHTEHGTWRGGRNGKETDGNGNSQVVQRRKRLRVGAKKAKAVLFFLGVLRREYLLLSLVVYENLALLLVAAEMSNYCYRGFCGLRTGPTGTMRVEAGEGRRPYTAGSLAPLTSVRVRLASLSTQKRECVPQSPDRRGVPRAQSGSRPCRYSRYLSDG